MIRFVDTPYCGNAVFVYLGEVAGATAYRLLRKANNAFTGESDPNATVVAELPEVGKVPDLTAVSGTTYFYQCYSLVSGIWSDDGRAPLSATPHDHFDTADVDVRALVRDRIDKGLAVEIARGRLKIQQPTIDVRSAPPQFDKDKFPIVSVHLRNEGQAQRFVGEAISDDIDGEGWLDSYSLDISGYCQNPDQRHSLHKALKRVLQANLPVFDAAGLLLVDFTGQDVDMLPPEYPAVIYGTNFAFNCQVASYLYDTDDALRLRENIVNVTAVGAGDTP